METGIFSLAKKIKWTRKLLGRPKCSELTSKLHAAVKAASFLDESARLIEESTAYDRLGLKNFLDKISASQGTHKDGTTDTIAINKAKEQSSAVVSA